MILWLIVGCTCLSVFFVVVFISSHYTRSLAWLRSPRAAGTDVLQLPMGSFIVAASTLFSGANWRAHVKKTEDRLIAAGNPGGKLTGEQFLGALLLVSIGVWLFNFLMLLSIGGLSGVAVIFPLVLGGATYLLGDMWLGTRIADRKKELVREFPYFIDMSVMVMGAGSTFPQAIKTYLKENPTGTLSSELANVSSEMDYGKSLVESMTNMTDRIETIEVKNALRSLVQGLKMGTPTNELLNEQADAMRFVRSQVAERVAESMKIKMQGPAMLLLFSVLILILGPAVVNFKDSGMF